MSLERDRVDSDKQVPRVPYKRTTYHAATPISSDVPYCSTSLVDSV